MCDMNNKDKKNSPNKYVYYYYRTSQIKKISKIQLLFGVRVKIRNRLNGIFVKSIENEIGIFGK